MPGDPPVRSRRPRDGGHGTQMDMKEDQSQQPQGELIAKSPDELALGMYVHLNCSWFKHPFPKNTFKISSPDQLATIRSLGLSSVLVDPQQSNPDLFASTPVDPVVTEVPEEIIDPALPVAADYCETVHLASQMYKQVLKRGSHILKTINAGSEEGVTAAKVMVDALSALILESVESNTVASLLAAAEVDNIGVLHAVNVSTLSMIVGRHLQLSHEEIRFVGMAGLLHDLGEQRIPVRILRNRSHLTQEELQELQLHPDYTVELLRRLCHFPAEILDIIRSHHERLDGSGYPARLRGSQLSLPARVLLVVDEYDSLVHKRRESESLMPSEALGQIYARAKTQFPDEVVVALIKTVGVYPPGSIVELSDGKIALVLSLNVEARMKPMVLLYDPTATNGRPRVIDLAAESDRAIARGLSKQQLSPAIRDYLNLYRWTGYFIQSSFKTLQEPTKSS
jgi:HD-GYP domain-containing protein (c-di-GMP phosphodiesterase class II)